MAKRQVSAKCLAAGFILVAAKEQQAKELAKLLVASGRTSGKVTCSAQPCNDVSAHDNRHCRTALLQQSAGPRVKGDKDSSDAVSGWTNHDDCLMS